MKRCMRYIRELTKDDQSVFLAVSFSSLLLRGVLIVSEMEREGIRMKGLKDICVLNKSLCKYGIFGGGEGNRASCSFKSTYRRRSRVYSSSRVVVMLINRIVNCVAEASFNPQKRIPGARYIYRVINKITDSLWTGV